MDDLQVGVVGAVIQMALVDQDGAALDVSTATLAAYLQSPRGKMMTVVPVVVNTGSDGFIKYTTTAATDLDCEGPWRIQAKVTISGNVFPSKSVSFDVRQNLYGV